MLLAESTRLLSLQGCPALLSVKKVTQHKPSKVPPARRDARGKIRMFPLKKQARPGFIIKMKYGVAIPAAASHSYVEAAKQRHRNHLMPIEWYFLVDGGGIHAPKIGGFESSTFLRINNPSAALLPNTLRLGVNQCRNGVAVNRKHCTDCEHDLTSPMMNSTRRGSRPY